MNQREKILAGLTGAAVLVGAALLFMPDDWLGEGVFVAADARQAKTEFVDALERIKEGPAILEAYGRVETKLAERRGDRTPEATFSFEMTEVLKKAGWETPKLKPPKQAFIKEVEDYYYVDLELEVTGEVESLVNLLIEFKNLGILIKAFELEKKNMDENEAVLKVTASRLAKADEDMLKKRKRRMRR